MSDEGERVYQATKLQLELFRKYKAAVIAADTATASADAAAAEYGQSIGKYNEACEAHRRFMGGGKPQDQELWRRTAPLDVELEQLLTWHNDRLERLKLRPKTE